MEMVPGGRHPESIPLSDLTLSVLMNAWRRGGEDGSGGVRARLDTPPSDDTDGVEHHLPDSGQRPLDDELMTEMI